MSREKLEDFTESLTDDRLREIFSNIKSMERKSRRIEEIEKANNMPIEVFLFKRYWVNKESLGEISRKTGATLSVIERSMKRTRIPRRNISNARKVQFNDPRRKQEIIAKIHSPDSDRKRSESMISWYEKHPGAADTKSQTLKEAKKKASRKLERQIQESLGEYPQFTLFRLHYIEGYSVVKISQKTGLPEVRVRILMRKYGVKNLDEKPEVNNKGTKVKEVVPLLGVFYRREAFLNPSEEYVIYRRYIDSEYDCPSLETVGDEMMLRDKQIRKIEDKAIEKLLGVFERV